jgi:hypothetical protein
MSRRTRLLVLALGLILPATARAQSRWAPSIGVTVNTALGRPDRSFGPGGTVALFRRSGRFGFGAELGYQRFGTEVTTIEDFNNTPGWVYREDIKRSMIRLAALARLEVGSGSVRPYFVAGAGAYDGRFKDRIEVRDANGQPVPLYAFEQSFGDVKPGLTAGLGLDLRRARGGPGLALEARWHGILDIGEDGLETGDFLSFGLALTW